MLPYLPAVEYPPSQDGYWGAITSTLNWCEEDYYATIYSAEIVNTLTNLLFMYLAAKGVRNCMIHQHDSIFLVAFLGYGLVGTGSFLFHSTLKYPMQLVDELSMIYTTCLMCYATFSYSKSSLFRIVLAVSLLALAAFITLYYHYLQDPAFHQNAFAILTATVLFRAMFIMEASLKPTPKKMEEHQRRASNAREKQEAKIKDQRDRKIVNSMWVMVAWGLAVFLGGFGLWTVDNAYCSSLRRWRRELGLPWGILLEGHGWWHLMTGTGSYFYIVWGIWLRHCLNERQAEYKLVWPRVLSFPEVVRTGTQD